MKQNVKILMAVDGSDQALNAVRYVGSVFPAERTRVVLFSVRAAVPESFLDLRKDAAFRSTMLSISAWETQTKKDLEAFMVRSKTVLMEAGFPDKNVTIAIQPKKTGIARDILQESYNGYNAVIVGRTGVSKIKDFVLGSVANKLVGKIPHIPVAVVGGNPTSKKVVVGFDGSEGATRAVSAVAAMLDPNHTAVTLCHIVRHLSMNFGGDFLFTPEMERGWLEAATKEMTPMVRKAESRLVEAGFTPDNISTEIVAEEVSRAYRLVKIAASRDAGTIVVGRRGLSMVEEFILGRVSTKVLNMAGNHAVWIA